jgi:hypothetical protein
MDGNKKVATRGLKKISAYQKVFSGVDGQRVLLDMMGAHGMLHSTFSGDVNQMLIKEGERNVVLRILTLMKADIKQLQERIEQYDHQMEE